MLSNRNLWKFLPAYVYKFWTETVADGWTYCIKLIDEQICERVWNVQRHLPFLKKNSYFILCIIYKELKKQHFKSVCLHLHHHHHHIREGLGVFPVPWSSRWSWSLHLFLGRPIFLRPFGLYCSACFGSLFMSILCTCCSHSSWYCFISFTMFCAPPRRYPYFDVVVGLEWSHDPESYAGGSVNYW